MSYESDYYSARSRYYNACSESNSCQNRINELSYRKQQKINEINSLRTEIKNNQDALETIGQLISKSADINDKLSKITGSTSDAAGVFNSMVIASDVANKDLSDVYSEEMNKTRSTVNSIFESLKSKRNALSTRIEELQESLCRAESEKQDIEREIRSAENSRQSWNRTKSNASADMEYYRRKMNEALYT